MTGDGLIFFCSCHDDSLRANRFNTGSDVVKVAFRASPVERRVAVLQRRALALCSAHSTSGCHPTPNVACLLR